MSSKRVEFFRQNTALALTLRFALIFLLSATALFITVDFLLSRAQLEKDQQQINSFVESYQRLEQQAGLHKLELVIERDTAYFQRIDMWVRLTGPDNKIIMNVQPESWPEISTLNNVTLLQQDNGVWREVIPQDFVEPILFRRVQLADGIQLTVGQSAASRIAQLQGYRILMLEIILPLIFLGLALMAYINWRSLRPVHDLISTVRSLKPQDLKARVIVRDPRSELGELAQLFNQKLNQIEKLIIGMQQSLDAVSHDLRTPLSRMRLSIEAALIESDNIDSLKEALMDSAEESQRMEVMLNTLLDISEAENGIMKLHRKPLDVGSFIYETSELYQYVAEEKAIQLEIADGGEVTVEADPVRLRQILGNLIDNALKYSPEDSLVNLTWLTENRFLILEIRDQGIGIDPQYHGQIFDRLFRTDQSRSKPGMGLGLSLVKAIVEAHGGQISIDSAINQGCLVRVSLPLDSVIA